MRLILMRHAKSSWADPGISDHDRPLNARGQRSASALGHWLRAWSYLPDAVLCSTAARTRQTLAGLNLRTVMQFLPELYHAEPKAILDALQQARGGCILLIGHNPGLGELAMQMVETPPSHPRFADFPTGATLVLDLPGEDWHALEPKSGRLVDFIVPRDLTD